MWYGGVNINQVTFVIRARTHSFSTSAILAIQVEYNLKQSVCITTNYYPTHPSSSNENAVA